MYVNFLVLSCIEILVGHVMGPKRLIAATFESFELLHLLRLNGMLVPSLHRESTNPLILH